jgi:hypothetical protein
VSTIRDRAAGRVKWKNGSLPRVETEWPHEARLMDLIAGCMSRVDASRWDLGEEIRGVAVDELPELFRESSRSLVHQWWR